MPDIRCPGQDTRYWTPDDVAEVACAHCGTVIEFFPDDLLRKCPSCGHPKSNPKFNMACLEWCQQAEKCMEGMLDARREAVGPVREALGRSLREIFGDDTVRIRHAEAVLALAEEIGRAEGADPYVLVPAALLHDIGLAGTEVDADTPETRSHGPKGADDARAMLADLEFPEPVAKDVATLIARHHDRDALASTTGKVLWDADLIVNLRRLTRREALDRLRQDAATETGKQVGERDLEEHCRSDR